MQSRAAKALNTLRAVALVSDGWEGPGDVDAQLPQKPQGLAAD